MHESIKEVKDKKTICRNMLFAYICAQSSKCERRKVGCVITKDGGVLSDGHNNPPQGEGWKDRENSCEFGKEGNKKTYKYVYHAETSAIAHVAASTQTTHGASLFVTTSPCMDCAKLIAQCGIKEVFFCEFYLDKQYTKMHLSGVIHLQKSGVAVYRLKNLSSLLVDISKKILKKEDKMGVKNIPLGQLKNLEDNLDFEIGKEESAGKIKEQLQSLDDINDEFILNEDTLKEVVAEENWTEEEKKCFRKEIPGIMKKEQEDFGEK